MDMDEMDVYFSPELDSLVDLTTSEPNSPHPEVRLRLPVQVTEADETSPPYPTFKVTEADETSPPYPTFTVTEADETSPPYPTFMVTEADETSPPYPTFMVTEADETSPPYPTFTGDESLALILQDQEDTEASDFALAQHLQVSPDVGLLDVL